MPAWRENQEISISKNLATIIYIYKLLRF